MWNDPKFLLKFHGQVLWFSLLFAAALALLSAIQTYFWLVFGTPQAALPFGPYGTPWLFCSLLALTIFILGQQVVAILKAQQARIDELERRLALPREEVVEKPKS